jgi:5-methylthioadenosine/S-adenosylhomocysteine deaminase
MSSPIRPQPIDTLIESRWIAPVEPTATILERHAIAISDGAIIDILPAEAAASRYSPSTHHHLGDHLLIPGLINLHTHAAMTLMRGLADDLPLMDWLQNHIWPVEMRLTSPKMVEDGTRIACAEMLRGGVTCFNDMYFFPEAAAQAAIASGIRASLGIIVIDFPSPYANDASDYLAKGIATRDAMRDDPLLSFCFAPHAPYSVSDHALERVAIYAGELDLPVHTHIHETAHEIEESLKLHGVRPLARLERCGLLSAGLIAVHAVHLNAPEIDLLKANACSVAHCVSSNLKLGSGIAPIRDLLRAGVNIGLGTDGAASNNRLDILLEMRTAALIAKGVSGDPTALSAHAALEMATLGGARALRLDTRIGSLCPGKRADIVAIDLGDPSLAPCYDPVSHLVYAAGRENVSHVWVDGRLRVADGQLVDIDTRDLVAKARYWKDKISA